MVASHFIIYFPFNWIIICESKLVIETINCLKRHVDSFRLSFILSSVTVLLVFVWFYIQKRIQISIDVIESCTPQHVIKPYKFNLIQFWGHFLFHVLPF